MNCVDEALLRLSNGIHCVVIHFDCLSLQIPPLVPWPCWKNCHVDFFAPPLYTWIALKPRFPPTFGVCCSACALGRSHFGQVLFTLITISMTWLQCGVRNNRPNSIISNGCLMATPIQLSSSFRHLWLTSGARNTFAEQTFDFIRREFFHHGKCKFNSIYSKCHKLCEFNAICSPVIGRHVLHVQ